MPPESRWANNEEDAALDAQRKAEKEARKHAKEQRRRKLREEDQHRTTVQPLATQEQEQKQDTDSSERPVKRRRLSPSGDHVDGLQGKSPRESERPLLTFTAPGWGPCRHVDNFERLNHIEEGSYGWVSRAKETATGEIVALKKLKINQNATDGFPVTGLREIQTLLESRHEHVVDLREVVVGDTLDSVFLVMEFLEHDLKTLSEDMPEPFLPSEVKTLMLQLTSAVNFLHSHWVLHRDLKTSNILMNNRGSIKIADFGMARYTSDPPPAQLTQLVVTLWYRAPELLLGAKEYDGKIDMWSVGCIFGELLSKEPLLQGKNEVDQVSKIFVLTGLPTDKSWPGFRRLPNAKSLRLPSNPDPRSTASSIRQRFPFLTIAGTNLLSSLLSLNPKTRPSAGDVMAHEYFAEDPRPKAASMFPTFPSKAGQEKRRKVLSPSAPVRGEAPGLGEVDFGGVFAGSGREEGGRGFSLNFGR